MLSTPIRVVALSALLVACGCTISPSASQASKPSAAEHRHGQFGPGGIDDTRAGRGMQPFDDGSGRAVARGGAGGLDLPAASGPTGGTVTRAGAMAVSHDDWAKLGYRWDWTGHPYVSSGATIRELDAAGDRVIVQDSDTVLSVLNAATGRVIWSTEMDRPRTRFVGNVRTGDTIVSCSETELFVVETETGNLLDRLRFSHVVNTEPVVVDNLAVFGSAAGFVVAQDMGFRIELWRYGIDGPVSTAPIMIDPRTMAVVSDTGDVLVLDVPRRKMVGRARISDGLASSPITDGYRLFLASLDQSVYCFIPNSGERLWRYRTAHPLRVQPAYHDGSVYVSTVEDGLVAIDANTGEARWKQPELTNAQVVAVNDGELIAWGDGVVAAVDADNGDVIARAEVEGVRQVVVDGFEDGRLYLLAGGGAVARFSPR